MAEKKNAEEVYSTCYHVKRRKTYLEERDVANGVFYYSALDTEQINGKDAIRNLFSSLCVDVAGYEVMAQRLHQCIAQLSKEEQALVFALCFQGKTQVELKRETGIKQQTTSYRNHQIRLKPKKNEKNKNIFCKPPHETGLVVRGFFMPQLFFENFISNNLNTLADGALKE